MAIFKKNGYMHEKVVFVFRTYTSSLEVMHSAINYYSNTVFGVCITGVPYYITDADLRKKTKDNPCAIIFQC